MGRLTRLVYYPFGPAGARGRKLAARDSLPQLATARNGAERIYSERGPGWQFGPDGDGEQDRRRTSQLVHTHVYPERRGSKTEAAADKLV